MKEGECMKHKKAKTASDLVTHFQKRCIERIGHLVKQKTLKDGMANGFLRSLGKRSNTRTYWKMDLQTGSYVVVYDKLRHAFVTVMHYDEWMASRRPDLKFDIKHPEYIKNEKTQYA